MKLLNVLLIVIHICIFSTSLSAQENSEDTSSELSSSVKMPVNLYDTVTFDKDAAPYIRTLTYISAPTFMCLYGFLLWGWGAQGNFNLKPETYKGPHAINGAADKYGHSWANYTGKRIFTFFFRASGYSKNRANIEGAILMQFTSLVGELGDGFSPNYGFDPYDILFNQFGILFGMLFDWSPTLDRMFTFKWEYFPSERVRNDITNTDKWDISTDYSDTKIIFTTKLGGIPYLSLTPLRYINIDVGYYTRGYRHSVYYPSRSRNIFLGFSVNFTIAFGDLLPVGYTSSSLQSLFNYYHPPWDYEAKVWVISDRPHEEFDY